MCFEIHIHITMNSLCWLYSCVRFICQIYQMSSGSYGPIFSLELHHIIFLSNISRCQCMRILVRDTKNDSLSLVYLDINILLLYIGQKMEQMQHLSDWSMFTDIAHNISIEFTAGLGIMAFSSTYRLLSEFPFSILQGELWNPLEIH